MNMYEQQPDFDDKQLLVVMDFPELENESQWHEPLRRPECYVVTPLKQKLVEISECTATPVERENSSILARTRKSGNSYGNDSEDLDRTRTKVNQAIGSDAYEIYIDTVGKPTSGGW